MPPIALAKSEQSIRKKYYCATRSGETFQEKTKLLVEDSAVQQEILQQFKEEMYSSKYHIQFSDTWTLERYSK